MMAKHLLLLVLLLQVVEVEVFTTRFRAAQAAQAAEVADLKAALLSVVLELLDKDLQVDLQLDQDHGQ
jgi:hypothetical protein